MDKLTFGSLFAGIGGFDLGFERAGMICKWQLEIDDYATKVLTKHWPNVHRERDIRECGQHNLQRVDVICGGFPCQDISYAGLGAGLDGERSGLFFEALRVVRELQPRAIVLENVAALLTRGLDRVLGTLAEIGFDAEWHCIPAAAVGAPHIRDRVFVLAYDRGFVVPRRTIFTKERRVQNEWQRQAEKWGLHWVESEVGTSSLCRIQGSWNDSVHKPEFRRMVDGVPDQLDRLRCLGNATVPQVAEYVGRRVVDMLTA